MKAKILFFQTMTRLKTLLDGASVEYTEKLFDTSIGISDLGSNPFVSTLAFCKYV